jgi:hypothetical protein
MLKSAHGEEFFFVNFLERKGTSLGWERGSRAQSSLQLFWQALHSLGLAREPRALPAQAPHFLLSHIFSVEN